MSQQEGQQAPAQAAASNGQPKAPKLAPAPVPQQTPWKAPSIDPKAAQANFESVDPPRRAKDAPVAPVAADASSAKRATTGKEKWVPYTIPVSAGGSNGQGRARQTKRQSGAYRQRRDRGQANQNGSHSDKRKSASGSPAPQSSGSSRGNGSVGAASQGAGNQRAPKRADTPTNALDKLQIESEHEPAKEGSASPPRERRPQARPSGYAPRSQGGPRKPRDPRYKMGYYGMPAAQLGYVPMQAVPVYGGAPPPDLLMMYLVPQVDFYFSLENLLKDMFLRRNMNNEGLVPISVIASFKRVRDLTPDVALVAQACAQAPNIEVIGSKVRAVQNHEYWVLAEKDRAPAGLENGLGSAGVEQADEPRFQVDQAVPFVPRNTQ